jgi:multiple sugar transport system substrate-binding protein
MSISRRQFLKTALAGGAGLTLAQYLPALAQDDLAGTINYIHHFTSETEFIGMERVLALFAQQYPNLEVVQENIPNADFMAKFTAAVVAETRPDTTMIAADRLPDMVGMNGVVDLTERINNWELREFFPENRWEGITLDGKLYGVPAFTFVDWGYYRTDWFEEAEIDGPPTTFDEFLAAAIKLTNADEGRYGFGMRGGDGGQGFIVDIIEAFGSPIVVDGQPAIDRDIAIDAITWWSELFTVHKVVPPSAPSDSFRQIMEGFKTGQTGMVWHHTGSLTEIVAAFPDGNFGTAVKPAGPAQYIGRLSYLYNGVMKEDNIDAAWAWVSYWGEADPAIAFLEETGYFPANEAVATDERITGNPLYASAAEAMAMGRLPNRFVGYPGWASNDVLPAFQRVLVGESTPEQAVDDIIIALENAIG